MAGATYDAQRDTERFFAAAADLGAELVGRLETHPNIVGMKHSASSGIERFLPFQGPSFAFLAGSTNFLFPAMMGGSLGGTVSLADSFLAVALRRVASRSRSWSPGSTG